MMFILALLLDSFVLSEAASPFVPVQITHATRFSISYGSDFKVVRFKSSTSLGSLEDSGHVLHNAGSTPDLATIASSYGFDVAKLEAIQVPVTRTAITSTLHAAFLEALGETGSLVATRGASLTGAYRVASACVNKMAADGTVVETADTAALDALSPGPEVTFAEKWSWSDLTDKAVMMDWDSESTVSAQADYIQLMSAYFNKESTGLLLAAEYHDSFACLKTKLAAKILDAGITTKPKVLWATWSTYSNAWNPSLDTTTYKGELTDAAGGTMLTEDDVDAAGKTALADGDWTTHISDASFIALASKADVIIYDDFYKLATDIPAVKSVLDQIPAVQQGRIFDVYKGPYWFERRIISPGVLTQDLAIALHPGLLSGYNGFMSFLRDVSVYTLTDKETLFPDPSACVDVDAAVPLPASIVCTSGIVDVPVPAPVPDPATAAAEATTTASEAAVNNYYAAASSEDGTNKEDGEEDGVSGASTNLIIIFASLICILGMAVVYKLASKPTGTPSTSGDDEFSQLETQKPKLVAHSLSSDEFHAMSSPRKNPLAQPNISSL